MNFPNYIKSGILSTKHFDIKISFVTRSNFASDNFKMVEFCDEAQELKKRWNEQSTNIPLRLPIKIISKPN